MSLILGKRVEDRDCVYKNHLNCFVIIETFSVWWYFLVLGFFLILRYRLIITL